MNEKKGFFNFFKGVSSRAGDISNEEQKQREYALLQHKKDLEQEAASLDSSTEEKDETPPVSQEVVNFCLDQLEHLLKNSGFESNITVNRSGSKVILEISNNDDIGRIIGKDGQTLDAYQTLIKAFAFKQFGQPVHILLDASDYLERRHSTIRGIALRAARSINENNGRVELKPMNASERRLVHILFKTHKRIRSFSEGEGRNRHVVLSNRDN